MSTGTFLAGGGSAVDESAVWDAMLDGVQRILYWPVALSGDLLVNAEQWLRTSLGHRASVEVTAWLDLAVHREEPLFGFDLVFVGGGNTFDLRYRLAESGLAAGLRRFLADGGSYYGGSAGAIVAGESIGLARGLDPDDIESSDDTGLRLVRGVDVLPHFAPERAARALDWSAQHPERLVIGIPEASGVHCVDGSATALGPEPVEVYRAGRHELRRTAGQRFPLPG